MPIFLTYRDKRKSRFTSLFPLCFLYENLQAQKALQKNPGHLTILKESKIVWSSVKIDNWDKVQVQTSCSSNLKVIVQIPVK